MQKKHEDLLKFFAENKDEYFSADNIPALIKIQYDPGMEIHDYLHEIQVRGLIKSDPKKNLSFKISEVGLEVVKSFTKEKSKYETRALDLLIENLKDEKIETVKTKNTFATPKQEKPTIVNNFNNNQFGNLNAGIVNGNLNQDSDFDNQRVTTTPKINESTDNKISWYNTAWFKNTVYPLLVIVITWLIISLIKGHLVLPSSL